MDKLETFKDEVNNAISASDYRVIMVKIGDVNLDRIIRARKYNGRQFGSSRLYTDIILDNNAKSIKISLQEDVISSVNIGKNAIDLMTPNLTRKFENALVAKVLGMGLSEDDNIPEIVYGKVGRIEKKRLIIGTQSMGGPIDYIYVGNGTGSFKSKENVLTFDGFLVESEEYAENQEIYLMVKSKGQVKFNPEFKKADVLRVYDIDNITIRPNNKDGITVTL
jgi:hypothetical protein